MKLCPYCNAIVGEAYNYCLECGKRLNTTNNNENTKNVRKSPKKDFSILNLKKDIKKENKSHKKTKDFSSLKYYKRQNNTSTLYNSEQKIDINQVDLNRLRNFTYLKHQKKQVLLHLRKNGIYIDSFDDLKIKLMLSDEDIKQLKVDFCIQGLYFNNINMLGLKNMGLSDITVSKIIANRYKGILVSSFEELKSKYSLSDLEIDNLKEHNVLFESDKEDTDENKEESLDNTNENIEISQDNTNENKESSPDNTNEFKTQEKTPDENNIIMPDELEKEEIEKSPLNYQKNKSSDNKIDINRANIDQLTKIPGINMIKAKKIIKLRKNNVYIESYEDLQNKLSISQSQIKQIKDTTIIIKSSDRSGRIIDV